MDARRKDAASGAYVLGSALLSAGKLSLAEWVFFEGRRFDENDYRFPAKIAAVRYEMGNYVSAVVFIELALSLLDQQPFIYGPVRQDLYLFMARACLLSGNLGKAHEAISNVKPGQDRLPLERSLLNIETMAASTKSSSATSTNGSHNQGQGHGSSSYPDQQTLWRQVIERLPKCRPRIEDNVEYIAVRSAFARSLADELSESDQEDYSFFFAHMEDARDFFSTLSHVGFQFSHNVLPSAKMFYFTLVDLKSAAFARMLLIFRMLTDWAAESDEERRVTIATLAYTFASQLMPSWVHERLHNAIRSISDELHTNVPLVMGCFCIDAVTRDSIFSHLRNWRNPPQQLRYTTHQILNITRQQLAVRPPMITKPNTIPQVCGPNSPDSLCFMDLGFMLPPLPILEENEHRLLDLARRFGYMPSRPPVGKALLEHYVASHWQPNVTLIDFDQYLTGDFYHDPRMNFTPQEVACDLYWKIDPEEVGTATWGAFEYLTAFFDSVARWSEAIRERIMVKIIINDAMDVMELAKLHVLNNDHPQIPDRYDRIDMSFLPDFIGGPLSTFTYGIPILRHDRSSEMRSFVCLNTALWTTHDQFLAEYLLLTDRSTITNTFTTSLTDESSHVEDAVPAENFSMERAFSWLRTSSKPLSWEELQPRHELIKWLHMHFLKLCLPPRHEKNQRPLIYTSLNVTAFFRLIIHLSRVGYPPHWLSAVLTDIYSGRISTQARAPKAIAMDMSEVMREYPRREIFIEPFVEEFRTQFAIWRYLLPFSILQEKNTFHHIDTIREYRQHFPSPYDTLYTRIYHRVLVLVLWNVSMNGEIPQDRLREILLDDEDTNPKYRGISSQSGRVHIISTVKFTSSSNIASFWFTDEPIQNILSTGSRWEAWIWDTNEWIAKVGPAIVNQTTLRAGNTWC